MSHLFAKLARAAGLLLLAVLAIWFLPAWLFSRCGGPNGTPEPIEPEYLHYKRLKDEKRKRWLFRRRFNRWILKEKLTRWERIEKIRKDFFN